MQCRRKASHLLLSVSVNPTHCVVASGKFPQTFKATGFSIGPNEVCVFFCWFYMLANYVDRAGNDKDKGNWSCDIHVKVFFSSDDEKIGF